MVAILSRPQCVNEWWQITAIFESHRDSLLMHLCIVQMYTMSEKLTIIDLDNDFVTCLVQSHHYGFMIYKITKKNVLWIGNFWKTLLFSSMKQRLFTLSFVNFGVLWMPTQNSISPFHQELLWCLMQLRCQVGPSQRCLFTHNYIFIENLLNFNSVPGHQIATNVCTYHDSCAAVSCAKFCSKYFISIQISKLKLQ